MKTRYTLAMFAIVLFAGAMSIALSAQQGETHYVRFQRGNNISFGIRQGDSVRELKGDLFQNPQPTGRTYKLSEVKLLVPLDWRNVSKIIGVGVNSGKRGAPRQPVSNPYLFAKFPQSLRTDGSEIEALPEMLETRLIYEGEMVLVIGKKARHVSVADAPNYIFGVAVGHDVSQFDWWWNGANNKMPDGKTPGMFKFPGAIEGKASESFAGIGTDIVMGVDYNNLRFTIKKNGKVVSDAYTDQHRNNAAEIVSYISRYIELMPSDLIYMGCLCYGRPNMSEPDQQLFVGDKIEFELEKVGVLRQTVVAAKAPPLKK